MTRVFAPVACVCAVVCLATTVRAARQAASSPPATDAGAIAGHVLDRASGHPIPGAIVTVSGTAPARRVVAGASGEFEFAALAPGSYTVRADRPAYLSIAAGQQTAIGLGQGIALAPGQHVDVSLAMWKAGAIGGTVTVANATADPVVGAEIHALAKAVVAGTWQWVDAGVTTSDDHGRYHLGNLAPADYLVVARPVQNPETSLLVAMLTANPTLAADVMANVASTSHEVPEVDARVLASSLAVAAATAPAASGRPLIVAIDAGTNRSSVDVRVRQSRGVRVAGRLTGAAIPTSGILVELLAAVPGASAHDRPNQQIQVATAACDGDGQFAFTSVPAGAYTLAATWMPPLPPAPPTPAGGRGIVPRPAVPLFSSDPALSARMPILVGASDVTNVTIATSSGPTLGGRVGAQDSSSAVSGVERTTLRLDPVVASFVSVPTVIAPRVAVDSNGRISSASIPPGPYWLRVSAPPGWTVLSAEANGVDVLDRPIDISSTSPDLVVTLTDQRLASIAGVVTSSSSSFSVTDTVTVIAFPAKADQRLDSTAQSRRVRVVRAQAGGSFFVGALPPGDYCLIAIAGDAARGWQTEEALASLSTSAAHVTVGLGSAEHVSLEVKR